MGIKTVISTSVGIAQFNLIHPTCLLIIITDGSFGGFFFFFFKVYSEVDNILYTGVKSHLFFKQQNGGMLWITKWWTFNHTSINGTMYEDFKPAVIVNIVQNV